MGLLSFQEECEACGADFRMEDAGDGPAVMVIFITGIFLIPMALAFYYVTNLPMIVTTILFSIIITAVSVGLLRVIRGVMFNMQWVNKAREARMTDVKRRANVNKTADAEPKDKA